MSPAAADPWSQVEDLSGNALYERLGVPRRASAAAVRAAFRAAARVHHPDKGGDARAFAQLRHAFEVLSDPQARATYDQWASQVKFRYVPGVTAPHASDSEVWRQQCAEMLDELLRVGVICDPGTQLACVCEVCGRPSTKVCYVCELRFCEACTRKQHWKGRFGPHWPVHNSPHMLETLGKKQLEKKRLEDGERFASADPNWRSEGELRESRAFKEAAAALAAAGDGATPDFRLQRYYMWAQSAERVFVALHVPTGYADRALKWDASPAGLRVQAEDSAPLVRRAWGGAVAPGAPVDALLSDDNRMLALTLRKASPGEHWRCVFAGDPHGARCVRPPYTLAEGDDDVVLDWRLPAWVAPADCAVRVTVDGVSAAVRGVGALTRTFWEDADARARRLPDAPRVGAVDPGACAWALRDADEEGDGGEEGEDPACARGKVLSLVLVKPPLTRDEIMYRSRVRADNRAAEAPGRPGRRGARFFEDDSDPFGLEDVLQALCFAREGRAWVPPKPHEAYGRDRAQAHWARTEAQLSEGARKQLLLLRKAGDGAVETA